MKTNTHFWSYLAQFFWEWEIFQTDIVEKIKTYILCSVTLIENRAVYAIRWKILYSRADHLHTYLLTYLLTYTMEQSPSREANQFVASQEIPRILWNPKVHYRIHNCPPPVPILSHPNPIRTSTSHFLRIHSNIILPSMPGSPQWSLCLRYPHPNPTHGWADHRWYNGACALHAGYQRLRPHTHTHTHSQSAILIPSLLQQYMYERVWILRYT
jgi:hypothetical protein